MDIQLLQCLLPSPEQLRFERYEIDPDSCQLTLHISSVQQSNQCPLCARSSERIHSRYQRILADLPCVNFSLILALEVCKFFCDNPSCPRRIFTERLPGVAAPWARKTVRLIQYLQATALALGGAAGAHLCRRLGYSICGSTLLNHLKNLPLPQFKVPKILGVDDFAFRKGHRYGTILVDLEQNQPIALLSDSKSETLADWLSQHPGVEILSRDRSKSYRLGMTEGAPEAVQVADRFHLTQNLGDVLETIFKSYPAELKAADKEQRQELTADSEDIIIVEAKSTVNTKQQEEIQKAHQRKVERHRRVWQLHEQGWHKKEIAQDLGISTRTVYRILNQRKISEVSLGRRKLSKSLLDPYKAKLLECWNSGIRNVQALMRLLGEEGYTGSIRTLQRYLKQLYEAQGISPKSSQAGGEACKDIPKAIDLRAPKFNPQQATYLVLREESYRSKEENGLLECLARQNPDLEKAISLADEFLQLLRQRKPEDFDDWLEKAILSALDPFKKFADGLIEDYRAVKAGITMEVSNGPVEGLINRLKMLKRQMYGRASLELLSKRFIMS